MKKVLITLMLLSFVCNSKAAEDPYQYCLFAGYAVEMEESFIQGLAIQLASDKKVMGTDVCKGAWAKGREYGTKARRGEIPEEAMRAGIAYSDFVSHIRKSILKGAGFYSR